MQALQSRVSTDEHPLPAQELDSLAIDPKKDDRQQSGTGSGLNRILVVEDDPALMALYDCIMGEDHLPVDLSVDGHDALEKLSVNAYDLVITDLNLPGLDGISLLQWLQRNRPETRVVVISGDGSAGSILAAMRGGVKDYLVKPFTLVEFQEMLNRWWHQPRRPINRQVFSSLMKQAMHDVHEEIANLELMIKRLEEGKFGKMDAGISGELHAMREKICSLKGVTADYGILVRNLLQGGNIPTERVGLRGEVIAHVLEEMRAALKRKDIKVSCCQDLSAEGDAFVVGNRVMLRSVFRTLFGNAVRNCPPSGTISYGIASNGRRYKLHVTNDGDAIPVNRQADIFDGFGQGKQENRDSGPDEGIGLGLPLAKDILRQHGGDLWYESFPKGSKFVCTLPVCGARPSGPT